MGSLLCEDSIRESKDSVRKQEIKTVFEKVLEQISPKVPVFSFTNVLCHLTLITSKGKEKRIVHSCIKCMINQWYLAIAIWFAKWWHG